jgi:outer membrane protein OmpA-like peptidoglycan-associated protein
LAAALLLPTVAQADGWFVAEAPAATAVSDAQKGVFRTGAAPAVGAYADNGWFAVGARVRVGALRNGDAPGNNLKDPGTGGLATAGLAMRVHSRGVWLELVGGGGVTGSDLVPTVEGGVGFTFPVAGVDIGPSARLVRLIDSGSGAAYGSADLLVVGIDVRFGVKHDKKPVYLEEHFAKAAPPVPTVPVQQVVIGPVDSDHDVITDARELSCRQFFDGCPLNDHVQMFSDRIVLDERVLFDFGRARVRTAGRSMIGEVAKMWHEHPDWRRITIEGHTDDRGSDEVNQKLSEERASNARVMLEKDGFAAAQLDAVGFGRSRPRVHNAHTEAEHQRNRRVEFVIERESSAPEVIIPGSSVVEGTK